jgi:hypothetical protein
VGAVGHHRVRRRHQVVSPAAEGVFREEALLEAGEMKRAFWLSEELLFGRT